MKKTTTLLVSIGSICVVLVGTTLFRPKATRVRDLHVSEEDWSSYTNSIITHAFWPKDEMLNRRRCNQTLLGADIGELSNGLAIALCAEINPTARDLESTIGVPEYAHGHDYLFLRYVTSSGIQVEVQDGAWLFITVSSPAWQQSRGEEIVEFAKVRSAKVIGMPTNVPECNGWAFSASPLDAGQAMWGSLTLEHGVKSADRHWIWPQHVVLWSDGRRVLLAIRKVDRTEGGGSPVVEKALRRFHYRR